MLRMAGGPGQLRPHVKTHKLGELVRLQCSRGIHKFKCATLAEMEMTAAAGAADVLLAFQPTGPNARRILVLAKAFPATRFSAVVDDLSVLVSISKVFESASKPLGIFLDLDCGMHRTGIEPGDTAFDIYKRICQMPGIEPRGLHCYDGHNNAADPMERERISAAEFAPILALRERCVRAGLPVPTLIASGTPTFPVHARHDDRECSPGTTILWDFGYGDRYPDLPFQHAAILFTRVISKPGSDRVCVDLGHKSVAAENPHPRVRFLNLSSCEAVMHSEEHLVLVTPDAHRLNVGDCLYGVPRHICPTVALHEEALVVQDGRVSARWPITARRRQLSFESAA
ncbi:MAG: D-TA family PLP-dependent enzyme [Pedosphaera sp.]|nr:D-TA family PLP-dependent enzyme [Pedosphaera sp.]